MNSRAHELVVDEVEVCEAEAAVEVWRRGAFSAMGPEFYETMLIIKGARAETEDDLNQLFEDFGNNGGQLAASFGPPTLMMDANLTCDAVPVTSPEREGHGAASTVDVIADEAFLAAPLSPSAYIIGMSLTRDAEPAPTLQESGRRCERGPRKRRIPLCTDQGWFLGDHFGDKWRNLQKSYTGNAERKCYLVLPDRLIERIKRLAINDS
ncbi:hypothetical protein D1007_58699 [Hordeum vulgare]|nr:hypothetical protein D1007_58699 [Hordeum vulgare]